MGSTPSRRNAKNKEDHLRKLNKELDEIRGIIYSGTTEINSAFQADVFPLRDQLDAIILEK
eukprot:gnl/Chilomastix_caulleri/7683.p2 GENE.gnl/Chilomastix_caulleri/7683~~gnl/Chilomastix_caulleri/7683.p2  ORF type:complete len:61 (+),score=15.40 gnl/Chilomastix_caulleri/7683:54-236(+)